LPGRFAKNWVGAAEEVRFKDNFICGRSDTDRIAFGDAMRQMWQMQQFPFALAPTR